MKKTFQLAMFAASLIIGIYLQVRAYQTRELGLFIGGPAWIGNSVFFLLMALEGK